ncbi:NAD(P)-binding domain-containing protein [Candidatus Poribacteria bacterium]|nr:NAD(P)-binding domain-containing protein [Candidatus Poribacteria bacterium]
MTRIALFGAGGGMGRYLTSRLMDCDYNLRCVEIGEAGVQALAEMGVNVTPQDEALADVDVVIFALPDAVVGKVSHAVVPDIPAGAMVFSLDVAAALAGVLCVRDDLAYFFTPPCHHNILKPNERSQHLTCALMQGPESAYALGEQIARDIHGPISKTHRLTLEQMGLLEPALAETVGLACLSLLRDAIEETVGHGVPREAAEEFLLGHMSCLSAFFGGGRLSEGAVLTMNRGKERLFRDDWRDLLTPESVLREARAIVGAEDA